MPHPVYGENNPPSVNYDARIEKKVTFASHNANIYDMSVIELSKKLHKALSLHKKLHKVLSSYKIHDNMTCSTFYVTQKILKFVKLLHYSQSDQAAVSKQRKFILHCAKEIRERSGKWHSKLNRKEGHNLMPELIEFLQGLRKYGRCLTGAQIRYLAIALVQLIRAKPFPSDKDILDVLKQVSTKYPILFSEFNSHLNTCVNSLKYKRRLTRRVRLYRKQYGMAYKPSCFTHKHNNKPRRWSQQRNKHITYKKYNRRCNRKRKSKSNILYFQSRSRNNENIIYRLNDKKREMTSFEIVNKKQFYLNSLLKKLNFVFNNLKRKENFYILFFIFIFLLVPIVRANETEWELTARFDNFDFVGTFTNWFYHCTNQFINGIISIFILFICFIICLFVCSIQHTKFTVYPLFILYRLVICVFILFLFLLQTHNLDFYDMLNVLFSKNEWGKARESNKKFILFCIFFVLFFVIYVLCKVCFVYWTQVQHCMRPNSFKLLNNAHCLVKIINSKQINAIHIVSFPKRSLAHQFLYTVQSTAKKLLPNKKIEDNILTGEPNTEIWEIVELVSIHDKISKITLMADTGASLCGINKEFALKTFPSTFIKKCKSIPCRIAGDNFINLESYIDITFLDNVTKREIITIEFYLIPGLMYNYLASLYLIRKLNWQFIKIPTPKFNHLPARDETFGSCNNWSDNENIHVNYDPHIVYCQKYTSDRHLATPYHKYIYACQNVMPFGTKLRTTTRVHDGLKHHIIQPHQLYNISNFKASKAEIEKAKQLTEDRQFNRVSLEHIKQHSIDLYKKMCHLCYVKYNHVWAKHQFHTQTIPNRQFCIDLKDEAKNMRIYTAQYHLNEQKRLVCLYHTMKNIENGLFCPNRTSVHNVPMIVVWKKKRWRPAYDFRKLNAYTKDVKSLIPSYNYLFEILRGRGKYTTSDNKNFFESIQLRKSDQDLCTVTTPLGRYSLTHATYGFKNIATYAQEITNEFIQPLGKCCAFIDDIVLKHEPDATNAQLLKRAEMFLQRASDMKTLLHPEKTYFFVDEVEFLGYIFNQKGHRPHEKYIRKILELPVPKTKKQLRAFVGLVQYIARYVHQLHNWTYWLTLLTRDNIKNVPTDKEIQHAVDTIKQKVQQVKLLYHPTDDGVFLVQSDASKYAIGAVLYQRQYDNKFHKYQWKIIEFFSKQIDRHLIDQPIMVKECLAISYACNHWKHFLLRKKFYIDTDHKNLIAMFDPDDSKAPKMSQKQIFITLQHALAMFHFELAHSPGADLILADWLSRDGCTLNAIDKNASLVKKYTQSQLNANNIHLIYLKQYNNAQQKMQFLHTIAKMHSIRRNIHCTQNISPQIKHIHIIQNFLYNKAQYNNTILSINDISMNNMDIQYINHYGYARPCTRDTHAHMYASVKPRNINTDKSDSNINLPNYNIDENMNRVSTRKKKPTIPFWEQKTTDQIDSEYESEPNFDSPDESKDDINHHNSDKNPDNNSKNIVIPKDIHHVRFPYSVPCKLIDSVYNKLHTTDQFEKQLTYDNFKKYQYSDKICMHLIRYIQTRYKQSWNYINNNFPRIATLYNQNKFLLYNQILYFRSNKQHLPHRICVPSKLIHAILEYEHAHNHITHPGTVTMIKSLTTKYYWYKMTDDIREYVKRCEICQLGKGTRKHKVGTLAPLTARERGELVHFDFAGPFFKRYHILVMVDHYSGQVVLHPCSSQSAESVVNALLTSWYPRHGLPKTLLTDRGTCFKNKANALIYKALGIRKIFTSAYHPQTNAKAERIVQEVKKGLRLAKLQLGDEPPFDVREPSEKEINYLTHQITLLLPAIEFSINQRLHSVTQVSPNMLTYGRNLRDLVDFKIARDNLENLPNDYDQKNKYQVVKQIKTMIDLVQNQHKNEHKKYVIYLKHQYNKDKYDVTYKKGDFVAYFVGDKTVGNKSKLARKFTGPWEVVKQLRHNCVEIKRTLNINDTTKDEHYVVHTGMLKPYHKDQFIPYLEMQQSHHAKTNIKRQPRRLHNHRRHRRVRYRKKSNNLNH